MGRPPGAAPYVPVNGGAPERNWVTDRWRDLADAPPRRDHARRPHRAAVHARLVAACGGGGLTVPSSRDLAERARRPPRPTTAAKLRAGAEVGDRLGVVAQELALPTDREGADGRDRRGACRR